VLSDEQLVDRVRAGDAQAAATLFGRHQELLRAEVRRRVRGVVRRRVGDSDVVQEAWIAAFERLDDFEDHGPGSFERWLRQIVRHKAMDTVRRHLGAAKRGGKNELSHGGVAPVPSDRRDTPGTNAARRDEGRRLRTAMERLTADQQLVLERVHKGGMSFVEVAEATGRSPSAVGRIYGRAVRSLARLLRDASADGGAAS